MYTVILINGQKYDITESEYKDILGKTGMVYIPSIKVTMNMSSVSCIEPKGFGDKQIDRSKQMIGIAPTGEVIIKRFGRWFYRDCNEYQRDDEGNSMLEYTEMVLLPTPEEYESKYKVLPPEDWKRLLISATQDVDDRLLIERTGRTSQDGLTAINSPKE